MGLLCFWLHCSALAYWQLNRFAGVLVPQTGAFAGLGADGVEGVKLAFEEINYEIAGRPVQLFFEDTAADPTLAVQKTQRLVEGKKYSLSLASVRWIGLSR